MSIAIFPRILISVCIIAALVLCLYFLFYKRNVNKALSEEDHRPMPSPGNMAGSVWLILLVILMLAFMVKLNAVKTELSNMNQQYSQQISNLQTQIESIYDNVDKHLKKESSLVTKYEIAYGPFHEEDKTADILFTVVPKTITDDMELSILYGNDTIALKRTASSAFQGTLRAGIFNDYTHNAVLTIKNSTEQKNEELEDTEIGFLWSSYLPSLNGYLDNYRFSSSKENGHLKGDIVLDLLQNNETSYRFVENSIFIVTEIGGKIVDQENIPFSSFSQRGDPFYRNVKINYDKTFPMGPNDVWDIYITAEDTAGYLHKSRLYRQESDSGASIQIEGSEQIYDQAGKLLYSAEKES